MLLEGKDFQGAPEAGKGKEGLCSVSEAAWPCRELDFKNFENIIYCCSKPPSLWQFVLTVLGQIIAT
jgi:hypothetical protein